MVQSGSDLTVVAVQLLLHRALEVADKLSEEGISLEVIDLRTITPLDGRTILRSVQKTNRLLIIEEAPRLGGWGASIASLVADEGIYYLDAPIKRVNLEDSLIAYSPALEDEIIPNVKRIEGAVRQLACRIADNGSVESPRHSPMVSPPSATTVAPVINEAASLTRNRATSAISEGRPTLPSACNLPQSAIAPSGFSGLKVSAAKRSSGVSIEPGQRLLTRTLSLA